MSAVRVIGYLNRLSHLCHGRSDVHIIPLGVGLVCLSSTTCTYHRITVHHLVFDNQSGCMYFLIFFLQCHYQLFHNGIPCVNHHCTSPLSHRASRIATRGCKNQHTTVYLTANHCPAPGPFLQHHPDVLSGMISAHNAVATVADVVTVLGGVRRA